MRQKKSLAPGEAFKWEPNMRRQSGGLFIGEAFGPWSNLTDNPFTGLVPG